MAIACVGDNCLDVFQTPGQPSFVGGNAVNVSVQLAALGQEVFYFGAVGNDAAGERVRDVLAAKGVRLDHLEIHEGVTAYTHIHVKPDGDRVIGEEGFGVCATYRVSDAMLTVLAKMDHVHFGWINDAGEARRRLQAKAVSVSQDVSVNNTPVNLRVDGLPIAFASAGEDEILAHTTADRLLAEGAGLAVVTIGAKGSIARHARGDAQTGITPVAVVDTTGAGDAFIAGFLAAHVAGKGLQCCLEAGRDHAAKACTSIGGFPQS